MKRFGIIILILVIIAGAVAYQQWNKPHKDMASANADIEVSASGLYADFESDETSANKKYLDKVVEVSGTVSEVTQSESVVKVVLDAGSPMGGVICELDNLTEHPRVEFNTGENVTFKGNCTGYLMDVVLVRCVEVK